VIAGFDITRRPSGTPRAHRVGVFRALRDGPLCDGPADGHGDIMQAGYVAAGDAVGRSTERRIERAGRGKHLFCSGVSRDIEAHRAPLTWPPARCYTRGRRASAAASESAGAPDSVHVSVQPPCGNWLGPTVPFAAHGA
jgi:hypothetical protein